MDWNPSASESGDDFEVEITTVPSTIHVFPDGLVQPKARTQKQCGAVVGHFPNKRRKMREAKANFNDTYFNLGCHYDEGNFERRFCMPVRCWLASFRKPTALAASICALTQHAKRINFRRFEWYHLRAYWARDCPSMDRMSFVIRFLSLGLSLWRPLLILSLIAFALSTSVPHEQRWST